MILILLTSIIVAAIFGLSVGIAIGRGQRPKSEIDKPTRQRLADLEQSRAELIGLAGEHAALGDNFAVLALPKLINVGERPDRTLDS